MEIPVDDSAARHRAPTIVGTEELRAASRRAEAHLYDAEVALHHAHQSGVDAWIAAAADKLHAAVVEHVRAAAALGDPTRRAVA